MANSKLRAFPWKEAMEFGFGVLNLSSKQFWQLSPRELFAAYRAFSPKIIKPLQREELQDLIRQFPDGEKKCD